jgi:predicted DNA-binding protein (UPF0251 family)
MYKRRRRRGKQGRTPSPVFISHTSDVKYFNPHPPTDAEPINLEHEELEVLRLVDLIGLSQEEAGQEMRISRGTIWRLLQRGRKKVTQSLIEGRRLVILQHEA